MDAETLAWIVTNLDTLLQGALLLGLLLQLLTGAALAGLSLRTPDGRRALWVWAALEEGDPLEGLITLLVITALALLVLLCST